MQRREAITRLDDAGARKRDGAPSWRDNPSRRGPRQQHDLAAEPAGIDPCMNYIGHKLNFQV